MRYRQQDSSIGAQFVDLSLFLFKSIRYFVALSFNTINRGELDFKVLILETLYLNSQIHDVRPSELHTLSGVVFLRDVPHSDFSLSPSQRHVA